MFQNPLCTRVLLTPNEIYKFHNKIRNPNLSYLVRKAIRKQIHDKAKKTSICPHCGETNGVVKKSGSLKISYEKYRNKKNDLDIEAKLCK